MLQLNFIAAFIEAAKRYEEQGDNGHKLHAPHGFGYSHLLWGIESCSLREGP